MQDLAKSRPPARDGKGKYLWTLNPKLKSLVGTDEYRRVLELLVKLKSEGLLASFLGSAERYWADLDIFGVAKAEQAGSGRGVANTVRRDWEKVWPKALEKDQNNAFLVFSSFWKRLEQSRLFDDVMQDVLPDMKSLSAAASRDAQSLANMDDEELRDEMLDRLQGSKLVAEYIKLCEGEEDVQRLAPDMVPFIAAVVAGLERKSAMQTEDLGLSTDTGVIFAAVAATLLVLSFVGVVKLPFISGEDDLGMPASKPTVVFSSDGDAPRPLASAPTPAPPSSDDGPPPPPSAPAAAPPSE